METNARITPVASNAAAVAPIAAVSDTPSKSFQDLEQASHYRLVIEEGPKRGTFIYKTLDTTTGKVLRQFPREQLVRLAEAPEYNAGSVIDTAV